MANTPDKLSISGLNRKIYNDINGELKKSLTVKNAVSRVKKKTATYKDINAVSKKVSDTTSKTLIKNIIGTSNIKNSYEFVNSVIGSKIKYSNEIINTFGKITQQILNEKQGINIKAVDGIIPTDRQYKILNSLIENINNNEKFNELLTSPLKNVIQSTTTEFIKANGERYTKAGIATYVSRYITSDTACDWCRELEFTGTYDEFMSNSNNAGFGQHDNCTCEIDMETVKE
jgi:hypothetical protein